MPLHCESNRMKIFEHTRVSPSSNSPKPSPELSLPLTFSDLFWLKSSPVERVFFYELSELTLARFNSEIVPKLKQSLSLTLHHYVPLTGNLKWPSDSLKPIISCTPNDSVSLTVAVSNSDFNVLSSNGVYEAIELHHLIPELITSDDSASTIALQITLFPDKGFCIGIAAHHGVLDGKTTTMFIKSWAHICNRVNSGENSSLLPPDLTPVFDRGVFKYPDVLDVILLKNFKDKSLKILPNKGEAENLVRSTVEITREDLKKLRERVLRGRLSSTESGDKTSEGDNTARVEGSAEGLHLSNFVLVYAYITTCIVKSRGNGDRNVAFGFTADCRVRLDPPLPDNYFGNCNTIAGQFAKARDLLDENGFVFCVEKVSDMVKEVTRKDVIDGMEKKLAYYTDVGKEFYKEPIQIISVAGSPRFDIYGSDFGWGKPVKVVVVSIDKNEAISLAESRDGNRGVEIGLALRKHELEKFSSLFLKGF